MKRIAWTTDLHLDFVADSNQIEKFCQGIVEANPDAVLIGGDIAVAATIEESLLMLAKYLQCSIYFVLGNHDFYRGSIAGVRAKIAQLTKRAAPLHWLSNSGVIELTSRTGLLGHDGWADGRLGNRVRSEVLLNDHFLIQEFIGLAPLRRFAKLSELGDEAARYLKRQLLSAVARYPNLILLTHVPPFKEACWFEGQISDDEFLPHFACSAVGDVLVEIMRAHPECRLTVLCGHTHGQGETMILPNLQVKTGGAEYGKPRLNELIVVD
ncbi:MAG: metallophosphoesterase [Chloroflexi bacterium]|nr:metallophosphoesterase [Chloroflexota bacterium]